MEAAIFCRDCGASYSIRDGYSLGSRPLYRGLLTSNGVKAFGREEETQFIDTLAYRMHVARPVDPQDRTDGSWR